MSKTKLLVSAIVAMFIVVVFVFYQRPFLFVADTNLAPATRTIPLYGKNVITQRIELPDGVKVIGGVDIFTNNSSNNDSEITLHVKTLDAKNDIRTVKATTGSLEKYIDQTISSSLRSISIKESVLHFSFEPVKVSEGVIEFSFEAPTLTKKDGVLVRYEIDDTKYSRGEFFLNSRSKKGDIGLLVYEQARIGTLVARWIFRSDNRMALLGLFLIIAGLFGRIVFRGVYKKGLVKVSKLFQDRFLDVKIRSFVLPVLLLLLLALLMFFPATKISFMQDDLQKLLRVEHFDNNPLKLIASVHRYHSPGNELETPVGFYRPFSFSAYSWMLYGLFGLKSFWYMLSNVALIFLLAGALFFLFYFLFGERLPAIVVSIFWLSHSAQVVHAYWWSLSEGMLANLFIILAMLCYVVWRLHRKRKYYILTIVLFVLALLSKEYALTLLIIFPLLEYVLTRVSWKRFLSRICSYIYLYAPFVIIAGLYLVLRTATLHDPTLRVSTIADESYAISFSPTVIVRNVLVYSSWAVEGWVWPDLNIPVLSSLVKGLDVGIRIYPGIFVILIFLLLLIWTWRNKVHRSILVFLLMWWLLSLGPVLLFSTVWNVRWYAPASWLLGGLVGFLLLKLPIKTRTVVGVILCLVISVWGVWLSRNSTFISSTLRLDGYGKSAIERYRDSDGSSESTVLFVGAPRNVRGTVNAYLLRLLVPEKKFKKVEYLDDLPSKDIENAVVIDMRDLE